MRIAFITPARPETGPPERLWVGAAKVLADRLETTIGVSVANNSSSKDWEQTRRISSTFQKRVQHTPTLGNRVRNRLWPRSALFFPEKQLEFWLEDFAPDFAFVSQGNNLRALPFLEACDKIRIPYAIGLHAAHYHDWLPDYAIPEAARLYQNARKIYSDSTRGIKITETVLGTALKNATTVYNPMSSDIATQAKPPPWPSEDTLKMLTVARLLPSAKGQDILLEVLASPPWKEKRWTLTLAGSGPQEQLLHRLVANHGLADKVIFTGHATNLRDLWKHHHLCVLPSRFEGLPIALCEAFACGRPAVVTEETGGRDIIDESEHGFIADHATPSALSAALEKAWQARGELRTMGSRAREKILQLYPDDLENWFAEELLTLAQENSH